MEGLAGQDVDPQPLQHVAPQPALAGEAGLRQPVAQVDPERAAGLGRPVGDAVPGQLVGGGRGGGAQPAAVLGQEGGGPGRVGEQGGQHRLGAGGDRREVGQRPGGGEHLGVAGVQHPDLEAGQAEVLGEAPHGVAGGGGGQRLQRGERARSEDRVGVDLVPDQRHPVFLGQFGQPGQLLGGVHLAERVVRRGQRDRPDRGAGAAGQPQRPVDGGRVEREAVGRIQRGRDQPGAGAAAEVGVEGAVVGGRQHQRVTRIAQRAGDHVQGGAGPADQHQVVGVDRSPVAAGEQLGDPLAQHRGAVQRGVAGVRLGERGQLAGQPGEQVAEQPVLGGAQVEVAVGAPLGW
nr:hypothetical protein [Kitasatospora acidiphila]